MNEYTEHRNLPWHSLQRSLAQRSAPLVHGERQVPATQGSSWLTRALSAAALNHSIQRQA